MHYVYGVRMRVRPCMHYTYQLYVFCMHYKVLLYAYAYASLCALQISTVCIVNVYCMHYVYCMRMRMRMRMRPCMHYTYQLYTIQRSIVRITSIVYVHCMHYKCRLYCAL